MLWRITRWRSGMQLASTQGGGMPAFAEALAAHEEDVPLRLPNLEAPLGPALPAALGRGVFRSNLLAGCLRRTGRCSRQSTPLRQLRTHAARHSDHIASPLLEYELMPACSQRVSRSWVATCVASGRDWYPAIRRGVAITSPLLAFREQNAGCVSRRTLRCSWGPSRPAAGIPDGSRLRAASSDIFDSPNVNTGVGLRGVRRPSENLGQRGCRRHVGSL